MRAWMKWTAAEQRKLSELASKFANNKRISWVDVASHMPHRTVNQCKTQYTIQISESPSRQVNNEWTDDECQLLRGTVLMYGRKWEFLAANYFQKRSAVQLRLKYLALQQKFKKFGSLKNVIRGSIGDEERQFVKFFKPKFELQYKQFQKFQENQASMQEGGELGFNPIDPLILNMWRDIEKNVEELFGAKLTIDQIMHKMKTILDAL